MRKIPLGPDFLAQRDFHFVGDDAGNLSAFAVTGYGIVAVTSAENVLSALVESTAVTT